MYTCIQIARISIPHNYQSGCKISCNYIAASIVREVIIKTHILGVPDWACLFKCTGDDICSASKSLHNTVAWHQPQFDFVAALAIFLSQTHIELAFNVQIPPYTSTTTHSNKTTMADEENQRLMEQISSLAGKCPPSNPASNNAVWLANSRCHQPITVYYLQHYLQQWTLNLPPISATGQINRAKHQSAGIAATTSPAYGLSRCTIRRNPPMRERQTNAPRKQVAYGRGGYYRGRASYPVSARGGYRVGKPTVHRHRSLVLNGSSSTAPVTPVSDSASSANSAGPSWISKTDRHLQLINTNVYQEQTEARTKAIEQTRLQKLQDKENRERAQFLNHLQQSGNPSHVSTKPNAAPTYEVLVDGIKFAVARNGSKLVKLPGAHHQIYDRSPKFSAHQVYPGDLNAPKATPRVAYVGGVKFYRTKNGNMYRQAVVQAQRYVAHPGDAQLLTTGAYRRSGSIKKSNVPCRTFSTTGTNLQFSFSPRTYLLRSALSSTSQYVAAIFDIRYCVANPFSLQVLVPKAPCAVMCTATQRSPFARISCKRAPARWATSVTCHTT